MPCGTHPQWLHDAADCPHCQAITRGVWRGYDHNGECLDCDEHADNHDEACPYWTIREQIEIPVLDDLRVAHELLARKDEELLKVTEKVDAREEIITNQLRNLGELRRQLDEALKSEDAAGEGWREAIELNKQLQAQLDEATAAATDHAAKLQWLINWLDARGDLAEHVFTFPDGDTWEVTRDETR